MSQLILAVNSSDHVSGNPEASVELVEYGDYECPYCGNAYPIVKDIQQRFGNELKFVFRNFPLRKIHPNAFDAAMATEAAGVQHKFWEMHDLVFENQKFLNRENIFQFARQISLDLERFQEDMQQKKLADKIEKDFETGLRSGVNRTPTFFINGEKYEGSYNRDELFQALKSQLNQRLLKNSQNIDQSRLSKNYY